MAKRVSVVLNQSVSKLGSDGDLVDVAPGFARNYLIPQGLASIATKGIIQQVEVRREKERQIKLAEKQAAENKKVAFKTIGKLTIRKQVGEENAIFGTVTTQEIADVIKEQAGIEVDRRGIEVPDVSKTGNYQAEVKLHPEVSATVDFQVIPL
ncbi:MAG: 50S ribosomal protein L9 [Pleurocapsa minor HA4230-MV1]|jgi:large subunit ribosomal protein L9|nr:50S ribosomal protein L9 [Pleurocapsa minor HA4230-MV1]